MSFGTVDSDDDDDLEYGPLDCTRCAGTGFCETEDPLWEAWDESGETECPACGGTGDRAQQTVF